MNYIGEWVETRVIPNSWEVGNVVKDLSIIEDNPDEFDFTYDEALDVASALLEMPRMDIVIRKALTEFKSS